ncbi:AAA family ATPase [Cryobacterium ruanii]|uniref:MinD/ParA family protein n=1 Tax=Cryobacterium ruanii TaxID=1259197 RepID=A0A4V3ITH9_9MICO|nr:AAA family ATPase [Cryobacterium ruanii]TFD66733.1 MinD/ParA family protein [Cryobacterium ruanii]
MSRLLLLGHSHEFETRLHVLLGQALKLVARWPLAFGPSAVLGRLVAADRPDAALLGAFLSHERAREISAGLARLYPGISIVNAADSGPTSNGWIAERTIHPVLDLSAKHTAVLPQNQQVGLLKRPSPVLCNGGSIAELEQTLELARDEPKPGQTQNSGPSVLGNLAAPPIETLPAQYGVRSQIIAVVAPKGGLGKTTVATNLAIGLARLSPLSVVLIDADTQFGDVATALSLNPSHTLPDLVTGSAPHDTIVLKTFLTLHPSDFYTVCGADLPADGDRVTGDQLSHLIQQLSEIFRYVIIDTAPGLGDHALAALELATDAVFLCDMSVPSARGLRKELAVLSSINMLPPGRHVVLNLADRKSGLSVRDIEATIGVPVDIAIPRSPLVALSTNRGIPILQAGRRNSASTALTALVHRFEPNAFPKRGHLHRRVVVT